MKGRGWVGTSRAAVGIFFACAVTWVLAQSPLVSAAGDPSAELNTAVTHAGFAAKYETMKEITLHLHHALNCLVGPQDKLFDAAAGNPCQGQGNGYLSDQKAAKGENSKHLAYLRRTGMVEARRYEQWMIYSPPACPGRELDLQLRCLQDCVQTEPEFRDDLRRLKALGPHCNWFPKALGAAVNGKKRTKARSDSARCAR